jgi:hypothetical protein
MDRQAKSLKLVGFSREERRVKRKEMKEYILCRWKNKKKKGGERRGRGEKHIWLYLGENLPQFSRWICKPDA